MWAGTMLEKKRPPKGSWRRKLETEAGEAIPTALKERPAETEG